MFARDMYQVYKTIDYYYYNAPSVIVACYKMQERTYKLRVACLLKAAVDVISPYLAKLFNRSLSFGHVPDAFKIAHISPP